MISMFSSFELEYGNELRDDVSRFSEVVEIIIKPVRLALVSDTNDSPMSVKMEAAVKLLLETTNNQSLLELEVRYFRIIFASYCELLLHSETD